MTDVNAIPNDQAQRWLIVPDENVGVGQPTQPIVLFLEFEGQSYDLSTLPTHIAGITTALDGKINDNQTAVNATTAELRGRIEVLEGLVSDLQDRVTALEA